MPSMEWRVERDEIIIPTVPEKTWCSGSGLSGCVVSLLWVIRLQPGQGGGSLPPHYLLLYLRHTKYFYPCHQCGWPHGTAYVGWFPWPLYYTWIGSTLNLHKCFLLQGLHKGFQVHIWWIRIWVRQMNNNVHNTQDAFADKASQLLLSAAPYVAAGQGAVASSGDDQQWLHSL